MSEAIKMKTFLYASMAALAAMLLSACSGSILPESKKIDYKSAGKQQLPSLEVPPDLTQPTRDDRYAVPDISPKGSATYSEYAGERRGGQASGPLRALAGLPRFPRLPRFPASSRYRIAMRRCPFDWRR